MKVDIGGFFFGLAMVVLCIFVPSKAVESGKFIAMAIFYLGMVLSLKESK